MTETWVSLSNIRLSKYQISNLGNVRTKYVLKQYKHNTYMQVTLYDDDNNQVTKSISSLVMEAFVGSRPVNMSVDHINRIRCENNSENLRYATHEQQMANRVLPATKEGTQIAQYDLSGNFIKIWSKIGGATSDLGKPKGVIGKVCKDELLNDGEFIPGEEWKPISYEGLDLCASSHGRIKLPSGKITYGKKHIERYLHIFLRKRIGFNDYVTINARSHRIIAEVFFGPSDLQVNHIDGDKENNAIGNLEYKDGYDNMMHAAQTGLITSAKPVCKFALNGQFLGRYFSVNEAARENNLNVGGICRVCKGESNMCGNFQWRYATEDGFMETDDPRITHKEVIPGEPENHPGRCELINSKSVCKLDSNDVVIAKYDNIKAAAIENKLSASNIKRVCTGKYITSGGFKWRWATEEDIINSNIQHVILTKEFRHNIDRIDSMNSKPIFQFDLNGNFQAMYDNIRQAAEQNKIPPNNIRRVCVGERKTCKNFKWRFVTEDELTILKINYFGQKNLFLT